MHTLNYIYVLQPRIIGEVTQSSGRLVMLGHIWGASVSYSLSRE